MGGDQDGRQGTEVGTGNKETGQGDQIKGMEMGDRVTDEKNDRTGGTNRLGRENGGTGIWDKQHREAGTEGFPFLGS